MFRHTLTRTRDLCGDSYDWDSLGRRARRVPSFARKQTILAARAWLCSQVGVHPVSPQVRVAGEGCKYLRF